MPYVEVFFCLFCFQWFEVRDQVVVLFVDIGGIVDNDCLNFLFLILSC